MYAFNQLESDDPLLETSPVMRALDFLRLQFHNNPSGILLTKSKALRRATVAEAISEIQWPKWTEKEIYHGFMPKKVADEYHFEPFSILHHVLLDMKLIRNYRGRLMLSKSGAAMFVDRFSLFDYVVRGLVFDAPYFEVSRINGDLMGTWDIWLNVLDAEAQYGISGKSLTETLYGPREDDGPFDPRTSRLYDGVLRPLVWTGLLNENTDLGRMLSDRTYTVTPLWKRYLRLDLKTPHLRVVH